MLPAPAPSVSAMEREMHQAPDVLATLCTTLLGPRSAAPPLCDAALWARLGSLDRLLWAACGSSRHAGLLGKYALAALADVPSQLEEAHEVVSLGDALWRGPQLCIALSQSGETQDTLEAAGVADAHGCPLLAIANVAGSTLVRQARWSLLLGAGPEQAVPATKSFLAQAAAVVALAHAIGQAQAEAGRSTAQQRQPARQAVAAALQALPAQARALLRELADGGRQRAALLQAVQLCVGARQSVFVGRGANVAVVQEGALKLQESSYLPARAFSLGEIKHGPMAMLEPALDVVVALVEPQAVARTQSGVERLFAVGVKGIVIGAPDCPVAAAVHARANGGVRIDVPVSDPLVWPLLATLVLQRLALEAALACGTPVDQPRYLVKQILTL